MSKITRRKIIAIAEYFEKHPEMVNFIKSSTDFTSSQETELWEDLAVALVKRFKMKSPESCTKDWIKTWWNDYGYELNRAYMNVLTNPEDSKLPAHYDVDLACRFLTVMGYDNVHRVLSNVKEKTSSDKEKNPQQLDGDLDIKITSYSIADDFPDRTLEPSQDVTTPAQPETIVFALKPTPNEPNSSQNTISSVSKNPPYFRPILPKPTALKSFENTSLPTIVLKTSKSPPCSTALEQELENSPNIVPIQPGTNQGSLNITQTVPEISECISQAAIIDENISKCPPCTTPVKHNLSESSTNSTPIAPLSPESMPNNDSSISEKGQDDDFSPNLSIDEALQEIAKEASLENSLAKRSMELKQKLLRLNKRKVSAVDLISKKTVPLLKLFVIKI